MSIICTKVFIYEGILLVFDFNQVGTPKAIPFKVSLKVNDDKSEFNVGT